MSEKYDIANKTSMILYIAALERGVTSLTARVEKLQRELDAANVVLDAAREACDGSGGYISRVYPKKFTKFARALFAHDEAISALTPPGEPEEEG